MSRSLVSLAIRGEGYVRAESRERIAKAAAELNYQPNLAARSLASTQAGYLGIVVGEVTNPLQAEIAKWASVLSSDHNFTSLVSLDADTDEKAERAIRALMAHRVSGVLLVGYAGVHPSVGRGYEFIAITAVVLGGVVLGGGRGWIVAAVAGAFVLEALFLVLNISGVPSSLRDAVQGVIIIAAVAYSGVVFRARRRATPTPASPDPGKEPDAPERVAARTSAPPALTAEGVAETRGD